MDIPPNSHFESLSRYATNGFQTTDLVLNVMWRCAAAWGLDLDDERVAGELYDICCGLEDWPEDEGFGSSDAYGQMMETRRRFHIPETMPRR